MKVTFNVVKDWLQELAKDAGTPGCVRRGCVRVCFLERRESHLPIRHLSLVASYVNEAGELVELVADLGQVWGHEEQDAPIWGLAQDTRHQVEAAVKECDLGLRGGGLQSTNRGKVRATPVSLTAREGTPGVFNATGPRRESSPRALVVDW